MKSNQLIILAGGKGTRLKDETKDTPKPLVKLFNNLSILDILLNKNISKFLKIYIFVGYKGSLIKRHINENYSKSEKIIKVFEEKTPMGTGGVLSLHKNKLEDEFVVINGDTWFDFDLSQLKMLNKDSIVQVLTTYSDNASRYGSILVNESNKIKRFVEKQHILGQYSGLINSGCYLMKKDVVNYISSLPCSLEIDIFPTLVEKKYIEASIAEGRFIDIGVPETLKFARENREFFKL